MNNSNYHIFREGNSWGYKFRGKGNFSTYQNVSICNDFRVSDIFRIGVKFSRRSKNSSGLVKVHHVGTCKRNSKMCWVQLFTFTIQFFLSVYPDFVIRDTEQRSRDVGL